MYDTQLQLHFADKTLPTFTKLLHFQVQESISPICIKFKDSCVIHWCSRLKCLMPAC